MYGKKKASPVGDSLSGDSTELDFPFGLGLGLVTNQPLVPVTEFTGQQVNQ